MQDFLYYRSWIILTKAFGVVNFDFDCGRGHKRPDGPRFQVKRRFGKQNSKLSEMYDRKLNLADA